MLEKFCIESQPVLVLENSILRNLRQAKMGVVQKGRLGSGITVITIYQLLSICRADNRDSIVLTFA